MFSQFQNGKDNDKLKINSYQNLTFSQIYDIAKLFVGCFIYSLLYFGVSPLIISYNTIIHSS